MYLIEDPDGTVRYPVYLRQEFPNTSFPLNPSLDDLPKNVRVVTPSPVPPMPPNTMAVEVAPTRVGAGWLQTWEIRPMNPDTIQARMDAALAELRAERNRRLSECDWMFFKDVPVDPATLAKWSAYRQRLRDLPINTDDLTAPVWPEKPE